MALDLLRRSAYCKRKRRWVRAHHGGARRREHVRGRGAAIVGTSGDLPSAASEKGAKKFPSRGAIVQSFPLISTQHSTYRYKYIYTAAQTAYLESAGPPLRALAVAEPA